MDRDSIHAETRALTDALAFSAWVAQSEVGVSVVAHLMRPERRHTQPRVVVMVAPARGPTHPKFRKRISEVLVIHPIRRP